MSWKKEIDRIERQRREALELGGAEAVGDPDTFQEQGPIAGYAEVDDDGEQLSVTTANYVLGIPKMVGPLLDEQLGPRAYSIRP